MNIKRFLTKVLILIAIAMVTAAFYNVAVTYAANGDRPNLVFVLYDQLGYVQMPGQSSMSIAPNLTRLKNEGVNMTNCQANNPLCSPMRASLFTGLYSHKFLPINNAPVDPTGGVQIGKVLKDAGYTMGYIGKWHLNSGNDGYDGFIPTNRRFGFEEYMVTYDYPHGHWEGMGTDPVNRVFDNSSVGVPVSYGTTGFYMPDHVFGLAVDYIDRIQTSHPDQPFALFVSIPTPHGPTNHGTDIRWQGGSYGGRTWTRYNNNTNGVALSYRPNVPSAIRTDPNNSLYNPNWTKGFYRSLEVTDIGLGKLLDKITSKGLESNTIVVLTSDHGEMEHAHNEGNNQKQLPWKESVNIPFLIKYPGVLSAKTDNDALFSAVDMAPTLLGLMGVDKPNGFQGYDCSQDMLDGVTRTQDVLYLGGAMNNTDEWRATFDGRYKLIAKCSGNVNNFFVPTDLYDTQTDPYEMTNLINNSSYKTLINKMWVELQMLAVKTEDKRFFEKRGYGSGSSGPSNALNSNLSYDYGFASSTILYLGRPIAVTNNASRVLVDPDDTTAVPQIINNKLVAPLSFIKKALGVDEVTFNEDTQMVTLRKGSTSVTVPLSE